MLGQKENINVGTEELLGKTPRVLFDTASIPWIVRPRNDDEWYNRGPAESILHDPSKRRMVVSLQNINHPGQLTESAGMTVDHCYCLVLEGQIGITTSGEKINPLGFAGPIKPSAITGDAKVMVVSFWGDDFTRDQAKPTYTSRSEITFDEMGPTKPGDLIHKRWFAANHGTFQPNSPGFNNFFHLGLGYASQEYIERQPDRFDDYTFQLLVPIPHVLQPNPEIVIAWQTTFDANAGDFVGQTKFGPYELGGNPMDEVTEGDYYQQLTIKERSLFFILHVMDQNGNYKKYPELEISIFGIIYKVPSKIMHLGLRQ